MTLTVDSYTRVPLGLCASCDIGGEPFARIDDFLPAIPKFVAHWRRQIQDGRAGSFRDVFAQKLLVSADGGAPFSLDPQGATMFVRQWATFGQLLRLCGVSLFDGLEPATPLVTDVETRFDYVCRIDPGPTLHVERTVLTTADGEAPELFRALAGRGVPRSIGQVPRYLVEEIRRDLEGKTRTETFETPLMPLVKRAREVMERTVVANHFLYFELIDDIIQHRIYDHENSIPDILTSHLVGWVSSPTRDGLRERVRRDFPGFDWHPSLARVPFFDKVTSPPCAVPPPPAPAPAAPAPLPLDSEVACGEAAFHPVPYGGDLAEILSYLSAHLTFYRWQIEGNIGDHAGAARFLVGQVPELQEGWSGGVPEPEAVDPAEFWEPSAERRSATSFRYALYDPPYSRAERVQIARLEPRLFRILFGDARPEDFEVWRFDTKDNSWFINEWWDFCWLALNVKARVAIAIYGTATD